MNYLRFLAAFFILSVCFSCKTKEVVLDPTLYVKIPDVNFEKELIVRGIDSFQDGQILRHNAEKVTVLSLIGWGWSENRKIKSLSGIEAFKNLTFLNCSYHLLSVLDLRNNINLRELYCSNNQLISVNLSKNKNLVYFYCESNRLTNFDITKNISLVYLNCSDNQLTSLDVTKNKILVILGCSHDKLINLDIVII